MTGGDTAYFYAKQAILIGKLFLQKLPFQFQNFPFSGEKGTFVINPVYVITHVLQISLAIRCQIKAQLG